MLKAFETAVAKYPADRRYLVGVSGGRDSMTLLHLLREHGFTRLIVCHLDHGLRGRASAADAEFVARKADEFVLSFEGGKADVPALARDKKLSLETAGRVARYAFFVEVARRRRCPRLFLAHHADDLAETFLFNLFRGSGTAGFSSLRSEAIHRVGKTELTIQRPFLGLWREDIDRFVQDTGIEFREDESNQSRDPMRNRIRQEIIPFIEEQLGRNIRQSVWRAAMIAAEENAFIEAALPGDVHAVAQLPVKALRAMPVALQRRVVRNWLRFHNVSDVGYDLVQEVLDLAQRGTLIAKINLPGDRHARRRSGSLFLE